MVKLVRIGVLKFAMFSALYSFLIGILAGFFMFFIFLITLLINPDKINWVTLVISLGSPFLSGITGFITGIIFTPIANLVLKLIKGIEVEFDED